MPIRLNVFLAQATSLSRRSADAAITAGRVLVNGKFPEIGQQVSESDKITLDGNVVRAPTKSQTIILNKPVGYVCSRKGQGSTTVYELLPNDLKHLNAVGRLDKQSSGVLIFTNDGQLAQSLTHPSFQKIKIYEISLNKPLEPLHQQIIHDFGISLEDGVSRLQLQCLNDSRIDWQVTMSEGRNRQIRRTFAALGYEVISLHRIQFGDYGLENLKTGEFRVVS